MRRRRPVDVVVDVTDFGDLVGIEVLDFLSQVPSATIPESSPRPGSCWSYDAEIDALYVHASAVRADGQRPMRAIALLDSNGQLIGFELPSPTSS